MPEDDQNGREEGGFLPSGPLGERERLKALVLDGVPSPESRRLDESSSWLPPRPFTRASVQEFRAHLEASGRAPSTINLRLAPIRKLALEASDNGLLDPARAVAIARVKGVRRHGVRLGNWVGAEEAGRLLAGPVKPYADAAAEEPVELRVYPGRDGAFVLYDDAGEGYGYEKGEYALLRLGWDDHRSVLTVAAREGHYVGVAASTRLRIVCGIPSVAPREVDYTGSAITVPLPGCR